MNDLMSDPGVVSWAKLLSGGTRPDLVRATILSAPEFVSRHGGSTEAMITTVYRALLGRDPNTATRKEAAMEMQNGGWNLRTFVQSVQSIEEASLTKVAGWYRSDLGRTAPLSDLKSDFGVVHWAQLLGRG